MLSFNEYFIAKYLVLGISHHICLSLKILNEFNGGVMLDLVASFNTFCRHRHPITTLTSLCVTLQAERNFQPQVNAIFVYKFY